jgi:para-nitrobenzyl esterase
MRRIGAVIAALAVARRGAGGAGRVKVEGGVVVGEANERANVFRAVPYAAPPVGDLRWAPPAP